MSRKATLYGNRTCAYCGAARMLLTRKGVEIENIDISEDPSLQEQMIQRGGGRSVPQIFIGDTHVGGFDDLCSLDASGELDKLLAD